MVVSIFYDGFLLLIFMFLNYFECVRPRHYGYLCTEPGSNSAVGPEVLKVSKKIPKLRVEESVRLGRGRLVEPGRRIFMATQQRAAAVYE